MRINNLEIGLVDKGLMEKTQLRLDNLTKPKGSLGILEELAKRYVAITGRENPELRKKVIFTLAADHGVAAEGVSAFPQEVTAQIVLNFVNKGAGVNVLARHVGAKVVVVDIGVKTDISCAEVVNRKIGYGSRNMAEGPAMTEEQAVKSLLAGIELAEEEIRDGADIIGTGDMGIANTTPSSAITAIITGRKVEDVTGRGTGVSDEGYEKKINAIKKALDVNKPDPKDGVDVLRKVGGFEIGGIAGIILGAASHRIPVVIDGFISGAGALIAYTINPKVKDYLIAAHCSVEKGHRIILEHLGLMPLLDLKLRLGEGTGAALGIGMVEAGLKILTQMASFEDAKVSNRKEQDG
ncbi:nicotinate-nucleotide--dimethylbenzimidazole phosphoribosyltransferase [Candidatus Woesearchaeota archaeon]|nr:nicotinate-nucleotide--dimethylbenzimidazole phosphoribosyltransferase [Candidatus Woesearchaeota archaeon]